MWIKKRDYQQLLEAAKKPRPGIAWNEDNLQWQAPEPMYPKNFDIEEVVAMIANDLGYVFEEGSTDRMVKKRK